MIAKVLALSLFAGLIGPAAMAAGGPAAGSGGTAPASPADPASGASQAPLVVTLPNTQPALPSGRIEMDPSQFPSSGNANELEPNIDGRGAQAR